MKNAILNKDESEQKGREGSLKKPFVSPQLVELGSAEELILGGDWAGMEDSNDDNPWGLWS